MVYLVSFMGSGSGDLALLSRGKFSKVAVVVTLPIGTTCQIVLDGCFRPSVHLVVKDLGFARLGAWDETLV